MFSAILRLRLVSQVSLLAAIAAVLYFYLTSTHSTPAPTIPFLVHQSPDMAALQYLKPIIVNPRAKHTATIIFLHVCYLLDESARQAPDIFVEFAVFRVWATQGMDGSPSRTCSARTRRYTMSSGSSHTREHPPLILNLITN